MMSLVSTAQFWDVSEPIRLGGTVNTEAEESIPVFSKDSSILYLGLMTRRIREMIWIRISGTASRKRMVLMETVNA